MNGFIYITLFLAPRYTFKAGPGEILDICFYTPIVTARILLLP